jgi:hypothetical protein
MRCWRYHKEAGTGVGEVLLFVGGFALIWFVFYMVTNWIYNTKEKRLDKDYEAYLKKNEVHHIDPLARRDFGGHQVICTGLFRKDCKEVQ